VNFLKNGDEARAVYTYTNVVFILGPVSINPALQLLKDRGLIGKISIATFDVGQKTLDGFPRSVNRRG
jgi:hypothetical protein